jgi:serine/threonine protein kinase
MTEIDEDVIIGGKLGEGSFAVVKKGILKDSGKAVAIKVIKKTTIAKMSRGIDVIITEIMAMRALKSPLICKLLGVYEEETSVNLIVERAPGMDLLDYICNKRTVSEQVACEIISQVFKAVEYMHSKGVAHRDLKLENIMIDNQKKIKIIDFGMAGLFAPGSEDMTGCGGSVGYIAPEVYTGRPYTSKIDEFAVGVILYVLV